MQIKKLPIDNEQLYTQWKLAIDTKVTLGEESKEALKQRDKLFLLLDRLIDFVLSTTVFSRGLDVDHCKSEAQFKFFKYWDRYDTTKKNAFAYAVQTVKNSNYTISSKLMVEIKFKESLAKSNNGF